MTGKTFDLHLRSVLERGGPFLSVYLDTHARTERGPEEIELRWRGLREQAAAAGCTDPALERMDALVPDAHQSGKGLAVVVAGETVALTHHLSTAVADHVSYGAAPHLTPLIEWQQDNPRYAVVVADREGAEIHVVSGYRVEGTEEIEGDTEPITKVHAGGWSEKRFQQRAQNTWEANARDVAAQLDRIARSEDVDFAVMVGDVRAIGFLHEHLSKEIEALSLEIGGAPATTIDDIRGDLEKVVAEHSARRTEKILEKFREERGQADLATDGLEETFDALRKAQVDTLLVVPSLVVGTAWFSTSDPTQAAVNRDELEAIEVPDVVGADRVDVLVAAALAAGSRVWVLPELPSDERPTVGIGALLRYA